MYKDDAIKELAKDYFHVGVNIAKDKEQVKEDIARYGASGHYDIMMKDIWVKLMSQASKFIYDNSNMEEIDRNGNGVIDYRSSMFILTDKQMVELIDKINEDDEIIDSLQLDNDQQFGVIQDLEEEIDSLNETIEYLKESAVNEEENITYMELTIIDLENNIDELNDEIKELSDKIIELENEC